MSTQSFAEEVVSAALEGGSFDGADIQKLAVKHGLLKLQTMNARCGDNCACAEIDDFPLGCYRKTELLLETKQT